MTLLQRLGLVAWWFGAFLGMLTLGVALWILADGSQRDAGTYAVGWAIASIFLAAPCWAIAFVLGGSFWRPPKP